MKLLEAFLAGLGSLTLLICCGTASAQKQRPTRVRTIDVTDARPVAAAMDAIEKRYGALIDYCDPVYAGTADTQLFYSIHGKPLSVPLLGLRSRTISVKYEEVKETPKGTPYLSCAVQSYACNPVFVWPKNGVTALIRKVLQNFAAQGGPVFTVRKISASYGPRWEVYPVRVRNSLGTFVSQPDFLAAKVDIPGSTIGSWGVLRVIAQQLTRKWGHKFEPGCCLFMEGVLPPQTQTPIGHAISTSARRAILEVLGQRWVVRTFCGIGKDPCRINPADMPFLGPHRPPTPAIPARMVPAMPQYPAFWLALVRSPLATLEIQRALAKAGFLMTTPTTKWTAGAIDALRRFQASKGLRPTGSVDIWTARKLEPFLPKIPAHLEPSSPAMDYALAHWLESTPDGWKEIEEGLQKAGFYHGPITGNLNDAAAALKAFQEANGIPSNGWFTYATAVKLAPYLPKPKE